MTDKTLIEMTADEVVVEIQRLGVQQDAIRAQRIILRQALHVKLAQEEAAKAALSFDLPGAQHATAAGASLTSKPH